MAFDLSVQAGESSLTLHFESLVGGKCGSRFCRPCRAERGLTAEEPMRKFRQPKADQDNSRPQRGSSRQGN